MLVKMPESRIILDEFGIFVTFFSLFLQLKSVDLQNTTVEDLTILGVCPWAEA